MDESLQSSQNDHLKALAELEKAQSKIKCLEHDLSESSKSNDILLGKFMKSENEYLGILKDLNHSNSKVLQLEKDLENTKSLTNCNSSCRLSSTPILKNDKPKFKKSFVCHHCGIRGHIRPFCYQLLNYSRNDFQGRRFSEKGQPYTGRPKNIVALSRNLKAETVLRPAQRLVAYARSNASNNVPFRNTMNAKLVWKPKISGGIVDSSLMKKKSSPIFPSRIYIDKPCFVKGETSTSKSSFDNHTSYSEKGTRRFNHVNPILSLKFNSTKGKYMSLDQISHLSEEIKRLSLLAKNIHDGLWKPPYYSYGKGEYFDPY